MNNVSLECDKEFGKEIENASGTANETPGG